MWVRVGMSFIWSHVRQEGLERGREGQRNAFSTLTFVLIPICAALKVNEAYRLKNLKIFSQIYIDGSLFKIEGKNVSLINAWACIIFICVKVHIFHVHVHLPFILCLSLGIGL